MPEPVLPTKENAGTTNPLRRPERTTSAREGQQAILNDV